MDNHDSYILRYTFNFNWQKFREATNTLKNVPVKLDKKPEQPQINAFMLYRMGASTVTVTLAGEQTGYKIASVEERINRLTWVRITALFARQKKKFVPVATRVLRPASCLKKPPDTRLIQSMGCLSLLFHAGITKKLPGCWMNGQRVS